MVIGIDRLIELAEKLGLIKSLKAKFINQPDPAASALATVLGEIFKLYEILYPQVLMY